MKKIITLFFILILTGCASETAKMAHQIHHNKDYWEDPHSFKPDRFNQDYNKKAFVPFGVGPRSCIGEFLARVELRTILIMLFKHFDFELDQSKPTEPLATITLRPKGGLFVKLRKRNE